MTALTASTAPTLAITRQSLIGYCTAHALRRVAHACRQDAPAWEPCKMSVELDRLIQPGPNSAVGCAMRDCMHSCKQSWDAYAQKNAMALTRAIKVNTRHHQKLRDLLAT